MAMTTATAIYRHCYTKVVDVCDIVVVVVVIFVKVVLVYARVVVVSTGVVVFVELYSFLLKL